jgi:putative copper export protein
MRKLQTKFGNLKAGYWTVISAVSALMISVMPVWAADKTINIWDRFSAIMRDFYSQILAISTILAVTMAAVALVVRMVSRNQRAVDEATAWLKRIVITWIILNSLGLIVAYLQPLITGGNYTG